MKCKNIFSAESFKEEFSKAFPEFRENPVEFFTEIDSTNSYAKRLLSKAKNLFDENGNLTEDGKELSGRIIFAESQTSGRGRFGRTFVSPQKNGIYVSIIYVPEGGISNPGKITAFASVAVKRALKKVFQIDAKIKWINDLYFNGKKICGILTEGIFNPQVNKIEAGIIGIGINIGSGCFKGELEKIAGGIINSSKINDSLRLELLIQVCANVLEIFSEDESSVLSEYKSSSFLLGKKITVFPIVLENEKSYSANAVDIDENASLIVELDDGTKKALTSGEVSVRAI